MDIFLIFLIIAGVAVLALIAINVFLYRLLNQTKQQIDQLLDKGNIKDFKDIFLSQKNKNDELEEEIKRAFSKIKDLEELCETTIRKVGVVRFNPFSDMGGNQSFIIAMLDNKNDGFLISSLFVNEGNRVYTKAVKNGKSEHALSPQEVEAINVATRN
jgi:polyhydroxyalkanoate synthesis regulator phasin